MDMTLNERDNGNEEIHEGYKYIWVKEIGVNKEGECKEMSVDEWNKYEKKR